MDQGNETSPARPQARAGKDGRKEHIASAKAREFALYYPQRSKSEGLLSRQPSSPPPPAHDLPQTLPTSPGLSQDHTPEQSEDKALSAFAQLGALRLGARRCLISFFDRRNCYIVAEATRSLCLHSGQPDVTEDSLCWGNAVFPKEMSLCYYTVNLGWKNTGLPFNSLDNHPSLVVDDLAKDDRFKSYPFVVGPPYSRFYAGVPIRSPSGHSIGTYCVLDDKPRDGLTPGELVFLKDMAGTVMRHLQMARATEDQRRGKIMVKSLGSFAEGKSGLENWMAEPWDLEQPTPSALQHATSASSPRPQTTSEEPPDLGHDNSAGSSVAGVKPLYTPMSSITEPKSTVETPGTDALSDTRPEPSTNLSSLSFSSKDDQKDRIAPEIKAAFGRAANMIVDATEAEGVAFFDAKISTFGGLVDDDFFSEQLPVPDKPCILLGAALSSKDRETKTQSQADCSMTESVLRHLLRAYPHGHIFNLDDEHSSPAINSPSGGGDVEVLDGFPFTVSRKSESMRSLDDESYLRTVFPKARSLVLYPLWDPHRDRWFASAFIWSSDPMRVFTSQQELSYLAAFSNSVMAEIARLDMKLADAAKADFISSISHELRSPLHGILGMTDLLKDSSIDNQQESHVATIETCGKTLLETINHVLDFAKINNLTRGSSRRKNKRTHSAKHMINSGQAHTNDIMTLINDVDMSVLTEDVVESVFAGYTYQKTSTQGYEARTPLTPEQPPISVVLDINRSENYVFRTQPGAWRRVIMNLFGNSLKYTPAGYIKVKLEVKPKRSVADECCEFRFSVTDSGVGMSEDYVNNRLFHSFAQENPLSQGTGLGLSIVKQIVESLGGDVEVSSEKGKGTKFTVSCPLKESVISPTLCATGSDQEKEKQLLEVGKRTLGMKVRFVGFDEDREHVVRDLKNKTAAKLSRKALNNLCADYFGMQRTTDEQEPDLIIATETLAQWLRVQRNEKPEEASQAPVVVVCQGAASAQSATAMSIPSIVFECIGQPVGPHKLAKALASCLDRHASLLKAQMVPPDILLPQVTQLSLLENIRPQSPGSPANDLDPPRPALTTLSSAPEIRSVTKDAMRKSIYSKPSRPLNCLAVDDNPINLRLLRTFIDKLGHLHVLATDGLEALETYKAIQTPSVATDSPEPNGGDTSRIDVILMDINMPRMDGLEATRQIRAHEIRNNIPKVTIIALTGVADAEIQQEANSSGINLFLIKPVRLADLEVILKGVITGQDNAILETLQKKGKDDQKSMDSAAVGKAPVQLKTDFLGPGT